MHAIRCSITSLCLFATSLSHAETPVEIVTGGSKALIVLPTDMEGQHETHQAVHELSHYIGKITGRALEILVEDKGAYREVDGRRRLVLLKDLDPVPAGQPEIHVGWTKKALEEIDKAQVEKLDIDGFLIRTTPDAVFLVGPKDWSTAYACYTFLEDFCGVRWFLPGEFGEDVPRSPELSIPVVDRTYEPAYKHRQYSGFQWRDAHELQKWRMHVKERYRLFYHHNLFKVFDVAKYEELYPEVYPILGGKRRIPGPSSPGGWQPCLTHPKAVEIAVDYAKEFFAADPDRASISLGINDGGRYCECERCMKLVDESLPANARRSKWFFQFANAVAERFDELFPDKLIGYLLYGECKEFPEGMKIHPKLIGFYVTPSYGLITPEGKQRFDEGLTDLTKSVSRFALYDWFYGDGICVPRLQIRQAKYYLEHGYQMGARHSKAEAYMNWGLDGFKYWIYSKLLWDPALDVDALMDEFYTRFFKESAKPMKGYFQVVERYTVEPVKQVVKSPQGDYESVVNFRFRYPEQLASFPPKAVEECEPFLDQAEKQARSYIVRERVKYFRNAFNVAKMMTIRYHAATGALPLLEEAETLSQGMPLLAKALHKDLDVEQYYRWVLKDDPFCVRYPEATMFGATTRARAAAANTLGRQIIDELRKAGDAPVTPAMLEQAKTQILNAAFSGISAPDALKVAKSAVGPFAGKIILCNQAEAPKIDGELEDPCWQAATVYADFAAHGTGGEPAYRTEARLVHDGAKLYIALKCFQKTDVILAWTRERDGRVWREDGVEILLNRPDDTTADQRLQAIINTNGNIFDFYNGDANWDGDIEVKTALQPEFYTMELSLPLRDVGMDPAKNRFLRINLVRNVYARKTLGGGDPEEISNWYLTPFSNLVPKARGWLVFN